MHSVIMDDPSTKHLFSVAEGVAASRATVLLLGESGTGKEVLARFIHAKSPRVKNGFYAINCAALPEGLLESELFGFEKGAFTGATQAKPGKFELAHGGTFLLDEVSELPLSLQAKLLRVLQEGEVERLGAKTFRKVDVRLICTANRDLLEMVNRGEFRQDLYYRLNVIPLRTVPLRYRPEEIASLARFFVGKYSEQNGVNRTLDFSAIQKLKTWKWPGNVRELENTLQRAVVMSSGAIIMASDIHLEPQVQKEDWDVKSLMQKGMKLRDVEKLVILEALKLSEQNRTQAALMLGISVRTLRNKINEYKIDGGYYEPAA